MRSFSLLILATALVGCGAQARPFTMYSSPFLQSDIRLVQASTSSPTTQENPQMADEDGASAPSRQMKTTDAATARAATKPQETQSEPASQANKDEAVLEEVGQVVDVRASAAEYAWSMYYINDVELGDKSRRSIPQLFRTCRKKGKVYHSSRPVVGDMAFFHNVFDANKDGRNNDWYSLVAIVEKVEKRAGTVTLLAYRDGKVERFKMNLDRPRLSKQGEETVNSQLRNKHKGDLPYTQYGAGELFAGFCSLLGTREKLVVVDNWQPGMKLGEASKR